MSKKLPLHIRVRDFNAIIQDADLLKKLRKLTLNFSSGLKKEINNLVALSKSRPVKAQALLAYYQDDVGSNPKLVGWALLSRENSVMEFIHREDIFHSYDGSLFEVYIRPSYRRRGIATELLKVARRKAQPYQLCVAPWDNASTKFFRKFRHYSTLWL